jgi:hypothetical protein
MRSLTLSSNNDIVLLGTIHNPSVKRSQPYRKESKMNTTQVDVAQLLLVVASQAIERQQQLVELAQERLRNAEMRQELERVRAELGALKSESMMPMHFMEGVKDRIPKIIQQVLASEEDREVIQEVRMLGFLVVPNEFEDGVTAWAEFEISRKDDQPSISLPFGLAVVPVTSGGREIFTGATFVQRVDVSQARPRRARKTARP